MHGSNDNCVSARMDAKDRLSAGRGKVRAHYWPEDIHGYRRPWRSRKHYNSKDCTLRTHRTGR